MRILITGADGFIGSRLFGYFSGRYHSVYGTVYYTDPAEGMSYLDMLDDRSFANLPEIPFDVCIHAAGTVDQSLPSRKIMEINGGGTKKVLQRLSGTGCGHFIQLSSITVYGKRVVGSGPCHFYSTFGTKNIS